MKLTALKLFSVVAVGLVAAQAPTDGAGAQLSARDEDVETFYATRAYESSHARRALEHMRSLAEDHAEFVARALDHFENLDARIPSLKKWTQQRQWDKEAREKQKAITDKLAERRAQERRAQYEAKMLASFQ